MQSVNITLSSLFCFISYSPLQLTNLNIHTYIHNKEGLKYQKVNAYWLLTDYTSTDILSMQQVSIILYSQQTLSQASDQQQRFARQLFYRMSYTDDTQSNQARKYKYNSQSIQPWMHFFKLLALKPCNKTHRNQLVLNIPDTVVFNDKDNPVMWFFTNSKGHVMRIDNAPYYTITEKFVENSFEKELVAVLKKSGYAGNDVKVISACEMKTVVNSVLSMRSQSSVIQRFVKTSSVKASIMRTCWRKNNCHEGWIVTSNYEYTSDAKVNEISKFIVNTKHPNTYNATKCTSSTHLNETLKYVKNIVKFVEGYLPGTRFDQMVCDFIKDEGGNWWYINTKAFILGKEPGADPFKQVIIDYKPISSHDCQAEVEQGQKKKLESYTKCKKCKYCYKIVAQHLLTHKLTLMMILQCDQNLIKMGKQYPWLDRCYTQHVRSVNLYVEHKVCDSCYKFYKEVQKLISLQTQLAKLSGIQVSEDNKNVVSITSVPYFKGHPPQFGSRLQKVKYDTQMPYDWILPQNEEIKIELNANKSVYKRCRFMIFIHGIRDIPREILEKDSSFSISYEFLQQTVKYKLRFNEDFLIKDNAQNPELFNIELKKMKIIYFFIESRRQISEFLKSERTLKVILWQDEQVLGKLQMQLQDFKSDKVLKRDYFKMFAGMNIFPYLSWGLFATLGLHEGPLIQTSSLKLSKKQGFLFPEQEYNGPDPLPEDWVQMIEERNDHQYSRQSTIKVRNKKEDPKETPIKSVTLKSNWMDDEINSYSKISKLKSKGQGQGQGSIIKFISVSSIYSKVKRQPYN